MVDTKQPGIPIIVDSPYSLNKENIGHYQKKREGKYPFHGAFKR
jgi:hypothetical protein